MEKTMWREAPGGDYWRIYVDSEFDVGFDEDPGEDPIDLDPVDEDALWTARMEVMQ